MSSYENNQIFLYWDDLPFIKTKTMKDDFEMQDSFADFIDELETKEQPEACHIDNPDCEGCGS